MGARQAPLDSMDPGIEAFELALAVARAPELPKLPHLHFADLRRPRLIPYEAYQPSKEPSA